VGRFQDDREARKRAPDHARAGRPVPGGAAQHAAGARRRPGARPAAHERRGLRAAHLDRGHGPHRRPVRARARPGVPAGRGRLLPLPVIRWRPCLPAGRAPGFTTLAARGFFYAVFKHSRLVVGVFLLVFLAAAVTAVVRPTTWRSNTKVLVKLGEMVQLAPAEQPSRSVSLGLTPEVVKTEAEIVKSSEGIRHAVARVGMQPDPDMSLDELIAKIQLALTVTPLPGSNVLQISYVGRSPERSARMVNAITDEYLAHHGHVYRNEGMHSFYKQQLKILYAQMKSAQKRLREYLQREHIVDVDAEISLLTKDATDQESNLRASRSKLIGTERKLEAVREQLDKVPAQVPYTEEYVANPTLQTFKNKLAEIEIERAALAEQYVAT